MVFIDNGLYRHNSQLTSHILVGFGMASVTSMCLSFDKKTSYRVRWVKDCHESPVLVKYEQYDKLKFEHALHESEYQTLKKIPKRHIATLVQ